MNEIYVGNLVGYNTYDEMGQLSGENHLVRVTQVGDHFLQVEDVFGNEFAISRDRVQVVYTDAGPLFEDMYEVWANG